MEETIIEELLPEAQNAQIVITMLDLLKKKKITLNEFLQRCAYWGMKILDDIYFMSLPSKPLEVIEFEQLSQWKRNKLTQEFFVDNPGIMEYYEQKRLVELHNNTDLWKLGTFKKYIPESDIESHKKLDKKIFDFKMKMEGYDEGR